LFDSAALVKNAGFAALGRGVSGVSAERLDGSVPCHRLFCCGG